MIFCSEEDYKTRKAVIEANPGAVKVIKVCGGWMVFATWPEYETWKNQK